MKSEYDEWWMRIFIFFNESYCCNNFFCSPIDNRQAAIEQQNNRREKKLIRNLNRKNRRNSIEMLNIIIIQEQLQFPRDILIRQRIEFRYWCACRIDWYNSIPVQIFANHSDDIIRIHEFNWNQNWTLLMKSVSNWNFKSA